MSDLNNNKELQAISSISESLQGLDEEAVVHLDDLLLRRTDWGMVPQSALAIAERVCQCTGWDQLHGDREISRLKEVLVSPAL